MLGRGRRNAANRVAAQAAAHLEEQAAISASLVLAALHYEDDEEEVVEEGWGEVLADDEYWPAKVAVTNKRIAWVRLDEQTLRSFPTRNMSWMIWEPPELADSPTMAAVGLVDRDRYDDENDSDDETDDSDVEVFLIPVPLGRAMERVGSRWGLLAE